MKKEDLFDILGDINKQYVKEAHMKKDKKNNHAWIRWSAVAACFALLVLCIPMITNISPEMEDNTPTVESLPMENSNNVEVLHNNEESANNQESESLEIQDTQEIETTGEPLKEDASTGVPETTIKDASADGSGEYKEEINSSDLTKDISDFYGGSYTDANGKFVIVLTEDTQANRTAICKKLGRSESNTTFIKGNYTLTYLTELQAKISDAMVNKELPFVTTSGVYETSNNIIVNVTTEDAAELAKLYALDTLGGAIEVQHGSVAGFE